MRDIDQRARRTRNNIARAIIELGRHQPLETITIGKLAEEAGISRSTFYAHFTCLEDYLVQSYAWMLERGAQISAAAPGGEDKPLAVRAILDHMARRREYVLATKASKFRPVMMTAGEERLQLVAATNLQRLHAHLSNTERLQLAAFIAGGFMAMLRSWIGRAMRDTPEEVQLYFEQFCDALLSGHPR